MDSAVNLILKRFWFPYKWNAQWIPKKVSEMIDCMNSEKIPESNVACKNDRKIQWGILSITTTSSYFGVTNNTVLDLTRTYIFEF